MTATPHGDTTCDTTRSCENGLSKVSEPSLDDRFEDLRHTVDREISRARSEVIAELARAVERMRSAATEPEWHEAVLDSGRIFSNEPAALDLLRSLAALTAPGSPATASENGASERASTYAESNGRSAVGHVTTNPPGSAEANLPDSMATGSVGTAAALRFARVKIAEIQLYHSSAVRAGRASRDLYGSLKPQIDDARVEFQKLFLENGSETDDYLHAEILHALAHDDATLLGPNYPGPLA
jgi:hypothetical protein